MIQYIKNYLKRSGTLWNYYRDISTDPITNSESFKYKTRTTRKTANNGNIKDVGFSVPLKYLSNFWKTLDMPLINCEVNLILTWPKNCFLTDTATGDADPDANPPVEAINTPTNATFALRDCKFHVPVVPCYLLKIMKLLEQLKT